MTPPTTDQWLMVKYHGQDLIIKDEIQRAIAQVLIDHDVEGFVSFRAHTKDNLRDTPYLLVNKRVQTKWEVLHKDLGNKDITSQFEVPDNE